MSRNKLYFASDYQEGAHPRILEKLAIRACLISNGFKLAFDSPTKQVFVSLSEDEYEKLSQTVEFSFWEKAADGRTIVRLATSWATSDEDVEKLVAVLM